MTPCNIITIVRHEGIPRYHIIKHEAQFKIHNTHAFIYTKPHYQQVPSRL